MQKYLNILHRQSLHIYRSCRDKYPLKLILKLGTFFYYLVYIIWFNLYKANILKSYSLPVPVISIGNITSGGTGKTTLTIGLSNYLTKLGYKVAILSRGYKRKEQIHGDGILLVSDGQSILTNPDISGDEPFLIARQAKKAIVIVTKDRVKGGLTAVKLGAEILILDDGYQYIRLKRNENILLLDCTNPFDNGCLLPLGYLREPTSSITRATAVILSNNTDNGDISKLKDKLKRDYDLPKDLPIVSMRYKIKDLNGINIKKTMSLDDAKRVDFIAFSGIGNPESFIKTLSKNEIKTKTNLIYPDHYNYSYNDIKTICDHAKSQNIENIITTSKDAIKIESACEMLPATFWSTNIEIAWDSLNPFEDVFLNKEIGKSKLTAS